MSRDELNRRSVLGLLAAGAVTAVAGTGTAEAQPARTLPRTLAQRARAG